jgi:flagellar biosynthesis GTPase FlhF
MHTPPPPIKQGNKRKAKDPLVNDSETPHKIRGLLVGIVCEDCNSKVVTRGTSLFTASNKQIATHFTNCSHQDPSNLNCSSIANQVLDSQKGMHEAIKNNPTLARNLLLQTFPNLDAMSSDAYTGNYCNKCGFVAGKNKKHPIRSHFKMNKFNIYNCSEDINFRTGPILRGKYDLVCPVEILEGILSRSFVPPTLSNMAATTAPASEIAPADVSITANQVISPIQQPQHQSQRQSQDQQFQWPHQQSQPQSQSQPQQLQLHQLSHQQSLSQQQIQSEQQEQLAQQQLAQQQLQSQQHLSRVLVQQPQQQQNLHRAHQLFPPPQLQLHEQQPPPQLQLHEQQSATSLTPFRAKTLATPDQMARMKKRHTPNESSALHVNVDIKVNKALQCFVDHASLVSAETQLERIRKYLPLIRKAIDFSIYDPNESCQYFQLLALKASGKFDSEKDKSIYRIILMAGKKWLISGAANHDVQCLMAQIRRRMYSVGMIESPDEDTLVRGNTFTASLDVDSIADECNHILLFVARRNPSLVQALVDQAQEQYDYQLSLNQPEPKASDVELNTIPGIIIEVMEEVTTTGQHLSTVHEYLIGRAVRVSRQDGQLSLVTGGNMCKL